jgi:chromate transporter
VTDNIYLRLTVMFTVLSLLGFGGGNAIIPQMHADVVDKFHWITSADFARFYGLGKLSPGATTTMAALVGFAVAGFLGAVVATLAVFVPSGVLVYVTGHWWGKLRGNPWRERVSRAIKPVVLGLIWAGVYTLARGVTGGPVAIGMAVVAAVLMLRTDWNQAVMVLVAGAFGAFVLH